MRLRTVLIGLGVLVVAALGVAVVVLETTDYSRFRGVIEREVKAKTGRDLKIGGEFKVVLGLSPSLAVENVTFTNASWGSRKDMVIVKHFEVQIDLLPLVFGNISVKRLFLADADILLETDAKGRGNWEFDTVGRPGTPPARPTAPAPNASSGEFGLPEICEVYLEGVLLVFHDGEDRTTKRFSLGHLKLKADSDTSPLKIDINGTYNDFYAELAGDFGSPAVVSQPSATFPIDVTAKLGASPTTVRIAGQLSNPPTTKGYDLRLTVASDEAARIADFARDAHVAAFQLPKLGPLKADLHVNDALPGGHLSMPSGKIEAGRPDQLLLKADGAIRDVLGLKGITLAATAEGQQIGALSGLVLPGLAQGLPALPALGPYKLAVQAATGAGDKLTLPAVRLDLGRDDLLKLEIDGAVQRPLEGKGYALNVLATAPDSAAVARQFKFDAPLAGPFSLRGKVADAGPDKYALSGVKLTTSGSDIGGDATMSLAGAKPVMTADLASTVIDLGKLLPGQSAAAPSSTRAAPAPSAPKPAADGRVFSADPLPFDLLNSANAELRYRVDALRTPKGATFHNLAMQASLRDGDMVVRPLSTTIGSGTISGELSAADRTGAVAVKLSVKGVELGEIDKEIPGEDLVTGGKTDADIDLRGTGKSVRALMGSLNGSLLLMIGQGTFKSRYADMLGFQGLEDLIGKSLPQQEVTHLNCLVSRFDIADGLATSRAVAMDTGRLTLFGGGTINLKTEQPSMRLNTHTKVTSLLSFLPPIQVRGTLADPSFEPDLGGGAVGAVGDLLGDVIDLPGRLFGNSSPARDICKAAIARATGRPASAGSQAPAAPAQPQEKQKPSDPIQDLGEGIQRGLRSLFGK